MEVGVEFLSSLVFHVRVVPVVEVLSARLAHVFRGPVACDILIQVFDPLCHSERGVFLETDWLDCRIFEGLDQLFRVRRVENALEQFDLVLV